MISTWKSLSDVADHAAPMHVAWQRVLAVTRTLTRPDALEKLYFFHTISNEDDLYMKIIALNKIYNFLVLRFFILGR